MTRRRGEKLLTALEVQKLSEPGRYTDGAGLFLEIDKHGGKRWLLRLQANGRRRDFGLGGLGKVPLKNAREIADDYRRMVSRGEDPIAENGARGGRLSRPLCSAKRHCHSTMRTNQLGKTRSTRSKSGQLWRLELSLNLAICPLTKLKNTTFARC